MRGRTRSGGGRARIRIGRALGWAGKTSIVAVAVAVQGASPITVLHATHGPGGMKGRRRRREGGGAAAREREGQGAELATANAAAARQGLRLREGLSKRTRPSVAWPAHRSFLRRELRDKLLQSPSDAPELQRPCKSTPPGPFLPLAHFFSTREEV